jgi:hypothetical protein
MNILITTHVVLLLLLGAKEIDMAASLEHIRDQRMALVRTKVTLASVFPYCLFANNYIKQSFFWLAAIVSRTWPCYCVTGAVRVCASSYSGGGARHPEGPSPAVARRHNCTRPRFRGNNVCSGSG